MSSTQMLLPRRFLTVLAGQTVSEVGSTMSAIGAAVFVFVETGNEAWLGALAGVAAIPAVLVGAMGAVIDRFRRRTVMIAADIVAAIGPFAALIIAITGRLEVWHLVVAGFISGTGNAIQMAASQAAIPALVEADQMARANGLKQTAPALALVLGPAIATPLLAWKGIEAVLIADLATFAVGVASVIVVRFDEPLGDTGADSTIDDDGTWRDMWAWLTSPDKGTALLALMGVTALLNFALSFTNIAVMAAATSLAGAARAGWVIAAAGLAMIVGGATMAGREAPTDRLKSTAVALFICGSCFALSGIRPSALGLTVGTAMALSVVPAAAASIATIYNARVPAAMQGRVFALRGAVSQTLQPVGSLLAGFTIARVAEPALVDGSLTSSFGRVIGTDSSSGARLVLLLSGLAVAALGVALYRSTLRAKLRADMAPEAAVKTPPLASQP